MRQVEVIDAEFVEVGKRPAPLLTAAARGALRWAAALAAYALLAGVVVVVGVAAWIVANLAWFSLTGD